MSKLMFIESKSYSEDAEAATKIMFEMEKGETNRIVWLSNLNQIADSILCQVKESAKHVDELRERIQILESSVNSLTNCAFTLTDSVDKLDKSQKKMGLTLSDVLSLNTEDNEDADPVETPKKSNKRIKAASKQSEKTVEA